MAINKAIIQIRRGPKDDLQFDKLLPGELAIATDAPCMWFCWAVGKVEQIPTSDNIEEVIAEIIEKYLKDNPVTGISEIYMRVYEGYIQYSSDGETYNDLISVSELKGAKGDPGSAGVGIRTIKQTTKSSEDGGTNVITITLSNDTKVTFEVLNGQKGTPGNAGVGIQSISQQTGNLNGGKNTIQIVLTNGNVQEVFTYNGKNGSDANVTLANIVKALGFTPASEEYVNNQVSTIPKFELEAVDSLPTANIKETTVYLLKSGDESDNLYTEYIYKNGKWEKLGSQTLDLSKYAEKSTTLAGYGITDGATKEQFNQLSQEIVDYKNDIPTEVENQLDGAKADIVQQVINAFNGIPVFGTVDENNKITLTNMLADGTYVLVYENENGTLEQIGIITVGNGESDEPSIITYEVDIASVGYTDSARWSTSGGDIRTGVTDHTAINLVEFERESGQTMTIHLSGITWKGSASTCAVLFFTDGTYGGSSHFIPLESEKNYNDVMGVWTTFNDDGSIDVTVNDHPSGTLYNGFKVCGVGNGANAKISITIE